MIRLDVRVPRLRRLALVDPKVLRFAEAQALNRTAANVQKVGLKRVSRAMGIKVSDLRKRGKKAGKKFGAVARGRQATRRRLFTSVVGSGRPFNVRRWGAQPVRVAGRTVAVQHSAYGRPQIAKRAWQLNSGAVVVRSGNSFRSVFGPGVGQMMERKDILRAMQLEATTRFPGHFFSAVRFGLSRNAPRFLR